MGKSLRIFSRPLGFREQLALTFTLGMLCLALLSSITIATLSSRTVRATLIEQGRRITEAFATQSILALLYQSADNAKSAAKATLAFPDIRGVGIYDLKRQPLLVQGEYATLLNSESTWLQVGQKARLTQETGDVWLFIAPVYTHQNSETEESPFVVQAPEPELIGFVRVAMVKATLNDLAGTILHSNLVASTALAAILLLLLLGITTRLIVPLKNLAEDMKRAERGEKNVRAEIGGPKDIQDMENAFNTMMTVLGTREEELKRARDAALESAHIKGEFAANVSHELRTPLNGILGMLELLQNMALTSKQQEYVQVAYSSGETLLGLIGNVLDFSRIESGKLKLDPVDFILQEMLSEVVGLLASKAREDDLDLSYVVAENVPVMLRGDMARIRQVLVNLTGNALKFTQQGEVAIEIRTLEAPAEKPLLRFEVKDTGIGVPAKSQESIFEAFTQADSSATRKYGGTGLGLAICRQLVSYMGGEIGVESELGKGSIFWFTVPLEATLTSQRESRIEVTEVAGLHVLIVDDSRICRRFLEQTLSTWGAHYGSAASGRQALVRLREAMAQGRSYDLALIDEEMPAMRGAELVRRIAEEEALAPVKIVLMGRQSQPDVTRIPGVMNYLTKPVQPSLLYDCIVASLSLEGKPEPVSSSVVVEEVGFLGASILIVEDNRANQQVAIGMLERLGCCVDVVFNGQEALEVMARQSYDLVLMDCHMPQMDGYEATRRFRASEAGKHRLPIIAMTANIREEDSDKCFAAGMSDYLPKPLKLSLLHSKLQHWIGSKIPSVKTSTEDNLTMKPESHYHPAPLDAEVLSELRTSVGDSFSKMIEVFLEDTPLYLEALQTAIAQNEAKMLKEAAHSLKGSARNFGATRFAQLSKQLEDLGHTGVCAQARELLPALISEYRQVKAVLQHEIQPDKGMQFSQEEGHARVLIVDDDRGMRMALRNILEQDGYRLEEVSNGAQALALCKRSMPDLILMDAVMPLLDGFEACTRIRALQSGAHTPVLIITALDDEKSIKQAFSVGANDYIPKPVHFAVLRRRVARLLEASRAEKHVYQLAYHDSLTGLPNRTLFRKHLGELLLRPRAGEKVIALLFLDLDRFKLINDTLGHDVGDMLLKAAADRIAGCLRSGDMVARLGGDEFTVILERLQSHEVAAAIATKICNVLSKPFVFMEQEMYVSASIGISMYPMDGVDIGSLIKRADTAMFRAKEQGDSFQFYKNGMETVAAKRLALEADLRRALERQEFILCYQPQLDLTAGTLSGMEALIRWHHPKHGLLLPAEFIPLAEETGLIIPLGEWVLREACTQVQAWLQRGFKPFGIAVNVSGRELETDDLVDKIVAILKETGMSAELLELEITESVIMKHAGVIIPMFRQLRKMGIKLAIDDFGTGYSSLSYLKRFPVDALKIDRSFVCDIVGSPDDTAIIAGIIALARSLRLKVIAEGVETREQEALLKDHQCDFIQGFYLSPPLSAAAVEQTILSQEKEGEVPVGKVRPFSTKTRTT